MRAEGQGRALTATCEEIYREIRQSRAKLLTSVGATQNLPDSLHEFLLMVADDLREGQWVAFVLNDAQLTTVEGARMLGVSRQFLIKLLVRCDIPHHMVGTHRRIYVRDLLAYKAKRDSNRRKILDDLTRAEAADGLHDLGPPDDREGYQ